MGTRDDGSASVEFIGISVLLLVPLVYLLMAVFKVQAGAFAVATGAREAGRIIAAHGTSPTALARAQSAVDLATADQAAGQHAVVGFVTPGQSCAADSALPPPVAPGQAVVVCVRIVVALPFADAGVFRSLHASVTVTGRYIAVLDRYRAYP